jgi:hypothetical protein
MSQGALCTAVRNTLRTALSLSAMQCDVTFDGRPIPICGETFVAVWAGDWVGQSEDADLDESIGVYVTLTRRCGYCPEDRYGPEVWLKTAEGMEPVLRSIVRQIHKSDAVRVAANALIQAALPDDVEEASGFVTPLLMQRVGRPEPKGPDWFRAEGYSQRASKYANAGCAQTIIFSASRRIQAVGGDYWE